MSKANPRKAVAALLPPGGGVIRPVTLGVFAALERIGSPLITGKDAKDTLELIPSLYLLTHDPREVFKGNILDLAMQWADSVPVETVARIREAAYAQINAAFAVIPESKKARRGATTAGSPPSSITPPRPTTGATAKSCGKSLSRHSRSCAASRSSKTAGSSRSR